MNIIRGQMTLSLTEDERKALEEKMKEWNMNQHSLVKLALRLFLFPKERSRIPVDGVVSVRTTESGEIEIRDEHVEVS